MTPTWNCFFSFLIILVAILATFSIGFFVAITTLGADDNTNFKQFLENKASEALQNLIPERSRITVPIDTKYISTLPQPPLNSLAHRHPLLGYLLMRNEQGEFHYDSKGSARDPKWDSRLWKRLQERYIRARFSVLDKVELTETMKFSSVIGRGGETVEGRSSESNTSPSDLEPDCGVTEGVDVKQSGHTSNEPSPPQQIPEQQNVAVQDQRTWGVPRSSRCAPCKPMSYVQRQIQLLRDHKWFLTEPFQSYISDLSLLQMGDGGVYCVDGMLSVSRIRHQEHEVSQ
eukprot:CAMPEP_0117456610 /NCGR_PEP_ID=MMETSP0759-20121206/11966_1 /TAXON_ID=63605 /ORGANISM="Percolomonas cosmopolitus, Strain WS" /LENGTH=286 /DNA_ID=CAMNT_0005249955 /DNA_START=946 /DNA_END=1807 /DNA_ORIENTATION=-